MRMTRAALRAQAQDEPHLIHEDANAESVQGAADPSTNQDLSRPALEDITYKNHPTANDVAEDERTAPIEKSKSTRKGKQTKKGGTEELSGREEEVEEPQGVKEEAKNSDHNLSSDVINIHDPAIEQETNWPQPSADAVDATPEQVQPLDSTDSTGREPPKTPKFDPLIHTPEEGGATPPADSIEDSFVDKIKTRSPSKMQNYPDATTSPNRAANHLMSHTPRIEDSVEAIDALEEAIEKISERLPVLDGLKIDSLVKSPKNTPARPSPQSITKASKALTKTDHLPPRHSRASPTKAVPSARAAIQSKPTTVRAPVPKPTTKASVVTKPPKKPIVDEVKSRGSSAPSQPLSLPTSPAKALQDTTTKRVASRALSTSKPGFVPAKSAKPPTKPTFSLPGEAISAKVKAQREERLRREEEAEKERKTFKARPIPTRTSRPSVVPRENKTSQARMSVYTGGGSKENVTPKPGPSQPRPRPSSFCAKPTTDPKQPNSSVRRTTSVTEKSTTAKSRVPSLQLTAGQKSTVTKQEAAQQKAKGKEGGFGRTKVETEWLEKERKAKEEAARKARTEAAERGRQASREWAEKQRKKLALQAAAKLAAGKADSQASSVAAP
ncbi:uncharacterized protein Z518_07671 [Rhinocladiella mackenziei CBS 650.93]|uniref:Carboxylesterase family protein n=1 Tax=Rhinocladiella mackenziei CBS 650.93 TaxID=1442369 RepID=A0A0D2H0Z5_9EURO|nr:uncharacterized protein Z518_07671 [Rhinocladiella mackenziei CBS 650.93]KIX04118.1 hypothetical protein Z518_07671 [Rhinocladiella mackenziei CBS 650.93]